MFRITRLDPGVKQLSYRSLTLSAELFSNICAIARQILVFRQQLQYLVINKQSRASIVQLYVILLKYSTRIVRVCKAGPWHRALMALSRKFPSMYQDFCSVAKELETQVSTQNAHRKTTQPNNFRGD